MVVGKVNFIATKKEITFNGTRRGGREIIFSTSLATASVALSAKSGKCCSFQRPLTAVREIIKAPPPTVYRLVSGSIALFLALFYHHT